MTGTKGPRTNDPPWIPEDQSKEGGFPANRLMGESPRER